MWLAINHRVPTWDFMQRRSWQGRGRCPLCKVCDEDISHILIHYSYFGSIWKKIEVLTNLINMWGGKNVEVDQNAWCQNPLARMHKELPCIFS
jgi:hypothetical protein